MSDRIEDSGVDLRTATGREINRLMTLGAHDALREHKKAGRSIVTWKDGRVVHVPADQIEIVDEDSPESPTENPPTVEGVRLRIEKEFEHFGGSLPERVAIAWDGYLAALIEWGLISASDHQRLSAMLPKVEDNPVVATFLSHSEP
jgi:hypothetical protein